MESGKRNQGWRETFMGLGRLVLSSSLAVAGLALGVGAIVQDDPVLGACGAAAGVTAGLIQQWRARFYRQHVAAGRERLRTQRLESEQVAAQLRQTVSALETELWQHRLVALATPAFGLQLSALTAAAETPAGEPVPDPADPAPRPPDHSSGTPGPEPFAQAS
jgi:hypothetical protein